MRRHLIVALVLGLAATVGGLVTSSANADSPTLPTKMVITSVTGFTAPAGTPSGSVPYAVVQAGVPFTVTVSFSDANDNPMSFNANTNLKITSTAGTLSPATGVAYAGHSTAEITTTLATAANRVGLTVTVAQGPAKGLSTGAPNATQLFDVLTNVTLTDSSLNFQQGIGGETDCTNATPSAPVCGIMVLPDGTTSSKVLLSLGVCDVVYVHCRETNGGKTPGAVIQALFADGGLYSSTSPATLIIKCDKTLCGGGSIQSVPVEFARGGNAELTQAPPCPAKGTLASLEDVCVDYVQSKRDGSGDTILYLLFAQDMRGGIG